jgi:EXLDI family protein
MPNKTIYVADADVPVFEQAQTLAGGNLSAAIAQAVRRYVAETSSTADADAVTVEVNEGGVISKKRFRGRLLARETVRTPDETRAISFKVYRTEKRRFAVWSRTTPNWDRRDWPRGWERPESWSGEWWRGESRLDVYESLEDLRDNIPAELYARLAGISTIGSDVEELDI